METGFQDKVSELAHLSMRKDHLRILCGSDDDLLHVLLRLPTRLTLDSSLLMPPSESRTLTSMWKTDSRFIDLIKVKNADELT